MACVVPGVHEVIDRCPGDVDPSTLPTISVEQDVSDWNHEIAGSGVHELVLTLAENLELESQALLAGRRERSSRPSITARGWIRCEGGSTTPRRPA